MKQATMGIIVGGGPAPGINGVIGAAAIEAINNGIIYADRYHYRRFGARFCQRG